MSCLDLLLVQLREMLKSIGWMAVLRGFAKVLAIIKTLILARILTPLQFGVFGIASLVLGFLEIITETGINVVLIQGGETNKKQLDSAWIVSIIRGAILFIVIYSLSPFIAKFFNNDSAKNILYLTSFVPLIRGFINPAEIVFQKKLEFKKEFYFKGLLIFIEISTAVLLGYLTRSEYCLIWGLIASSVVEVVFSQLFISPRPKLNFDLGSFKYILKKGIWITFAGTFNYIFQHGDDVVVGKILGVSPLGLYQQAYRISSLPVSEMAEVFQKVTFPYYSKYQNDLGLLKNTFKKSFLGTSLLVIPFGMLLIIFPYQIVNLLLGPNWLEATEVLRILAVFGMIKALTNSIFPLLLGLGKQNWVTYITLIGIVGMAVTIFPLTKLYGITGTATSTIIGTIVTVPISLIMLFKIFKRDTILKI